MIDLQNDLSLVEKDLMLRQLLWQSIKEWEQLHQNWIRSSFSSLDVNVLQKEVSRFVQTIYLMEKGRLFLKDFFYLPYGRLAETLSTPGDEEL